jgi:hypothetical protein
MKKIIFGIAAVLSIVVLAAINVNINLQQSEKPSIIILANIEALSIEQPNVDDCIEEDDIVCEALYPTDPDLDKQRKDARW